MVGIFLFTYFLMGRSFGFESVHWSQVKINPYFFDIAIPPYQEEKIKLPSITRCGGLCSDQEWCLAFCYESLSKECTTSNTMVSPLHQDTDPNAIRCHTSLKKDLAFGSDVTGVEVSKGFLPNGTASNLARGIHTYNDSQTCSGLTYNENQYFLFDLKETFCIREVRITTQSIEYKWDLPIKAMIQVGADKPFLDNFAGYTRFATMPEDVTHNQTYIIKPEPKNGDCVEGRYVGIQTDPEHDGFTLCYVQIFD